MNSIRRNLKRAREAKPLSREQYSYESWILGHIRGMVEYWADEHTLNGDKMTGHSLVRWKKDVYRRIQQLNEVFQEDEKLRKEARK